MDERTLEVMERWHRMTARRWWRMIRASHTGHVHHEVSREIADHLSLLRSRKAKQRKCADCRSAEIWLDDEMTCAKTGGDEYTTTERRVGACGPSGKLWEPK